MAVFFTSDQHFGHENICRYCNRPYESVEHMQEAIIEAWNRTVTKHDSVYVLGDVALGQHPKLRIQQVFQRLEGQKFLVRGNHDQDIPKECFGWVKDTYELKVTQGTIKARISMCHFPFRIWNQSHHGAWNLHGHSHNTLKPKGMQLDVGVDSAYEKLGGLRPFSLPEVAVHMLGQMIHFPDHHTEKTY